MISSCDKTPSAASPAVLPQRTAKYRQLLAGHNFEVIVSTIDFFIAQALDEECFSYFCSSAFGGVESRLPDGYGPHSWQEDADYGYTIFMLYCYEPLPFGGEKSLSR